ncbi:Hypothetical protein ORPV_44 [Orpheovirus IHUMI-LCC2]|uniref:Uncharacterized protein n=1 Tax=Orpheovirus IHUMI-LCC2 TaxID=2023057 RepID=A0A2I2L335_9VIRU|nr:Hypothetical protein ORPV_44 [Orpheovirus IHUMI-LCC2]SNW61948.1 Hypothetical protein ORPV_44 [Orpheovirus IHUMI-LCC2]
MGNKYNKSYCQDCKKDLSRETCINEHDACDMCGRQTCYKSDMNRHKVKNWHCQSCSFKWAAIKAKHDPSYPYR